MSGTTLRIVLTVLADMLAVAGGVLMFLRTGDVVWIIGAVLLSGVISLAFLLPALRAARQDLKG